MSSPGYPLQSLTRKAVAGCSMLACYGKKIDEIFVEVNSFAACYANFNDEDTRTPVAGLKLDDAILNIYLPYEQDCKLMTAISGVPGKLTLTLISTQHSLFLVHYSNSLFNILHRYPYFGGIYFRIGSKPYFPTGKQYAVVNIFKAKSVGAVAQSFKLLLG